MNLAVVPQSKDDVLIDTLIAASGIFARMLAESLEARANEITVAQYQALLVLARSGPTRPLDFTEVLGVDPSTTTRLCDRLVRRGLIVRERPEHNRREVQIALSPSGQALIDAIATDRRARFSEVVDAVPMSRRPALLACLEMLVQKTTRRLPS